MKWRISVIVFGAVCGLSWSARFHVVPVSMTWDGARAFCRENHTDLASVSNSSQMTQLQNAALENPFGIRTGVFWIGLLDDLSQWSWSDGGPTQGAGSEYRNWDLGQPDNLFGLQMCARMGSGGFWDDADCPLKHPFVCFNEKAGPPYVYVEEEMTWSDAQRHCRDNFTDLVRIQDSNQNRRVSELAQNREVWIGLYRRRVWSDGTEATYENWRITEPNNGGGAQHCTAMDPNDGLWTDESCSLELPFVCHGPDDSGPAFSTISPTPTLTTTPNSLEPSSTTFPTSDETTSPTPGFQTPHVMLLDVNLTSAKPLTEAELSDLASTEFRQLLIRMGLPANFRTALKTAKLNDTEGNELQADDG